jgi:hypothetical protein
MSDQLLNMLIQLPIVAVFVWYSDRMNKQFQEFLREERSAREIANREMAQRISSLDTTVSEHRADFSRAVEIMKERTQYNRRPDDVK